MNLRNFHPVFYRVVFLRIFLVSVNIYRNTIVKKMQDTFFPMNYKFVIYFFINTVVQVTLAQLLPKRGNQLVSPLKIKCLNKDLLTTFQNGLKTKTKTGELCTSTRCPYFSPKFINYFQLRRLQKRSKLIFLIFKMFD